MKAGVTILLCVAGLLFLGWIGRPLWNDIVLLRAEINRVNSALADLEQSKRTQEDLIAAYNAISDQELDLLLNQHLPKKTDTGTLLIALEDLARRHNATINTISFKETASQQPQTAAQRQRAALATASEQQPNVEKLAFTFSLSASYEDFKAFLESLESHIRLVDVESISFSGNARGVYTVSLAAKTYYRK